MIQALLYMDTYWIEKGSRHHMIRLQSGGDLPPIATKDRVNVHKNQKEMGQI